MLSGSVVECLTQDQRNADLSFFSDFALCPLARRMKNGEYDQELPHHKLQINMWHLEEAPNNNHKTPGRQKKPK